jgi:hypothetical protein
MKILQLSSILFSTVVINSFYLNNYIYHHLSLLILISSIFYHGYEPKERYIIKIIDLVLAKYTYFHIIIYDTPKIINNCPYIIICPISILLLYISEYIWIKKAIYIHFILHIVSIISMHLYLYKLLIKN